MSSVSVIVPCYNYGHFLPDCVASILGQQGVDVRVLIIDDTSTDNSAEVVAKLAASDARVEARYHKENRGHILTYNEGLDWVATDYVALLSADDLLVPGALGRAARLMDAHPSVGFVYGRPIVFNSGHPLPAARTGPGRERITSGQEWVEARCRVAHGCIASPEVVVRSSLQREVGGYRVELPHWGDIEMWLRLAAHSDVGYVLGADQAYYRIHAASMQRTRDANPLGPLRERKRVFDFVFAAHGPAITDAGRLQGMAERAIARDALWAACRAYDRRRLSFTPVDELVEFAFATYPQAGTLREYRSLQWRQRAGRTLCPLLQPVLIGAALRRVRAQRRWTRAVRFGR